MAKMRATSIVLLVVTVITILTAAGFGILSYAGSPIEPENTQAVSLVVPRGRGVAWIGEQLKEKGLIRSSLFFRILAKKEGLDTKIQAGSYSFTKSQNMRDILQGLTRGTDDTWVTVLEGWRNEEIAETLGEVFGENFDTAEFLTLAEDKEGYLFPDTYLLPNEVTPATAISLMENTFNRRVTEEMRAEISAQGRTLAEVVTLASIVEREANTAESMQMVAGILLKRLENDWPLQADATLQYVKGYNAAEKSWWAPPLAADKELRSPYNTYENLGLPPGPIANPGLNAIQATITPTESQYWYYITDNQGIMRYAVTLDEHNANVDRYLR